MGKAAVVVPAKTEGRSPEEARLQALRAEFEAAGTTTKKLEVLAKALGLR